MMADLELYFPGVLPPCEKSHPRIQHGNALRVDVSARGGSTLSRHPLEDSGAERYHVGTVSDQLVELLMMDRRAVGKEDGVLGAP